ncbi:MAG: mechanosensitive ion channel family protein [Erysipelotrichia bacterium]|nr:mechanosensitive ion channel family protein [Erysipelotrichia bacterium]
MDLEKILTGLKEKIPQLIINIVIILLVWLIAKFVMSRISAYTKKAMEKARKMDDEQKGKSIVTAMTMTRSVARYLVYFLAFAIILTQLGFGTVFENVLFTATVGSLIISLGVQSIIKDVVNGMLLMFEKQYSVGDYVKIGEYQGTVTSIAMRVTYLDCKGKKVIIPNGQINEVINFTNCQYALFELTIPTSYEENTAKVITVLTEIVSDYYKNNSEIFIDKPNVYGISNFNNSSVDIYLNGKVKPMQQWNVERELRLLIKERFDELNIFIPYQQIMVNNQKTVEK